MCMRERDGGKVGESGGAEEDESLGKKQSGGHVRHACLQEKHTPG